MEIASYFTSSALTAVPTLATVAGILFSFAFF